MWWSLREKSLKPSLNLLVELIHFLVVVAELHSGLVLHYHGSHFLRLDVKLGPRHSREPEEGGSLIEIIHSQQQTLVEHLRVVGKDGVSAARPVVLLGEVIVAGPVHPVFECENEAVGELEVSVVIFVKRLFLEIDIS